MFCSLVVRGERMGVKRKYEGRLARIIYVDALKEGSLGV